MTSKGSKRTVMRHCPTCRKHHWVVNLEPYLCSLTGCPTEALKDYTARRTGDPLKDDATADQLRADYIKARGLVALGDSPNSADDLYMPRR